MAKSCLIYLLSATLLTAQTAVPAGRHGPDVKDELSVASRLANIPIGATLKVQMADGRTLKGDLVSTTGTDFALLEKGQSTAQDIKSADVKSVRAVRSRHGWVGTAALVGGFLAATGVAVAMAGTIW